MGKQSADALSLFPLWEEGDGSFILRGKIHRPAAGYLAWGSFSIELRGNRWIVCPEMMMTIHIVATTHHSDQFVPETPASILNFSSWSWTPRGAMKTVYFLNHRSNQSSILKRKQTSKRHGFWWLHRKSSLINVHSKQRQKSKKTRVHSSSMRTVRCSGRLMGGDLPRRMSAWGVAARGCLPRGVCPGEYTPPPPLPPCAQTDTCENITFPQHLRTVKTLTFSLRVNEP